MNQKTMTTMNAAGAGAGARMRFRVLMLGMVMAVLAGFAVTGWAQPMGGGGHHGMGGGGMMMGGSPERMGRMIDHMLDGVGATDEQRSQVKQIAMAAATDLKTQRDAGRGLHERAMQVFTAPNVDANAAESVRQQMLAQHDQVSRRMTQAIVEISRVLTPEQRVKLGERMKERMGRTHDRMDRMQKERPLR